MRFSGTESYVATGDLTVAVNAAMRAPREVDGPRRGTGILLDLARLLVVLVASAMVASNARARSCSSAAAKNASFTSCRRANHCAP